MSQELCKEFLTQKEMASSKLPNYLRTHRKRAGLSQDDVAFLLGTLDGAKVCRHERFVRDPGLETALAYEAIFKRSISELFVGVYSKVAEKVAARARALSRRVTGKRPARQVAKRQETLGRLAGMDTGDDAKKP